MSTAHPLKKPSTNEYDVTDKPHYVRSKAPLTSEEMKAIRLDYRERVRSLLAVDEMVRDLVLKLKNTGELNNTYIFFWSDNGYLHGEHRLTKKRLPYEESTAFREGPLPSSRGAKDVPSTNVGTLAPPISAKVGAKSWLPSSAGLV